MEKITIRCQENQCQSENTFWWQKDDWQHYSQVEKVLEIENQFTTNLDIKIEFVLKNDSNSLANLLIFEVRNGGSFGQVLTDSVSSLASYFNRTINLGQLDSGTVGNWYFSLATPEKINDEFQLSLLEFDIKVDLIEETQAIIGNNDFEENFISILGNNLLNLTNQTLTQSTNLNSQSSLSDSNLVSNNLVTLLNDSVFKTPIAVSQLNYNFNYPLFNSNLLKVVEPQLENQQSLNEDALVDISKLGTLDKVQINQNNSFLFFSFLFFIIIISIWLIRYFSWWKKAQKIRNLLKFYKKNKNFES